MSKLLQLNTNDFLKGLIVAILVVVLGALQQSLNSCGLNLNCFNWSALFKIAYQAGLAYLAKNLLTSKNGKFLGKIG